VERNEAKRTRDPVYLEVRKRARITQGGHRMHGARTVRPRGTGWEHVPAAADDYTRVAYAEVVTDENRHTAAQFLSRALAGFPQHGVAVMRVLSDNGGWYRRAVHCAAVDAQALTHRFTCKRPYRAQPNGKAERFIWAPGPSVRTETSTAPPAAAPSNCHAISATTTPRAATERSA
jgi:hypothetical protein